MKNKTCLCYQTISILLCLGFLVTSATAKSAPESFSNLAKKLLPTVVNISTTQTIERQGGLERPQLPPGSPFEEFFKEFFERNQPNNRGRQATSLGSGFIVDQKGYIVTNNHVIEGAEEITVILHDDTRLKAKVVGRDSKTDLAVLNVTLKNKKITTKFGDSDKAEVGDWVVAIGNPFGLGGSVTAGIISARGRDINAGPYDDFLQTDASINKGNSGGPLFNLEGEVIGVNTAIFSPSGGSIGLGFSIPSNVVEPIIQQLIKFGEVKRGWLGVHIQTVTDEIAETLGLEKSRGALVASAVDNGPAQKGGIKAGDIILEFDSNNLSEMRQLPRIVAKTEPGRKVKVKIWRDGEQIELNVIVGELKEVEEKTKLSMTDGDKVPDQTLKFVGLKLSLINAELRDRFKLDDKINGVIVTEVDPNGPASTKGISPGDRIIQVSQQDVSTPSDVVRLVKSAKKEKQRSVLFRIQSQARLRFVAIRIDQN